MTITPIGNIPVDTFIDQHRLQREYYHQKKQVQEFQDKKIELNERVLEAYFEKLDRQSIYNKERQLQSAPADRGRFLDIEV